MIFDEKDVLVLFGTNRYFLVIFFYKDTIHFELQV